MYSEKHFARVSAEDTDDEGTQSFNVFKGGKLDRHGRKLSAPFKFPQTSAVRNNIWHESVGRSSSYASNEEGPFQPTDSQSGLGFTDGPWTVPVGH